MGDLEERCGRSLCSSGVTAERSAERVRETEEILICSKSKNNYTSSLCMQTMCIHCVGNNSAYQLSSLCVDYCCKIVKMLKED